MLLGFRRIVPINVRKYQRYLHSSTVTFRPIKDQLDNTAKGKPSSDYFVNLFDRGPNVGIEVITKHGFVLSNNVQIEHPLILVNGSPFLWKVPLDCMRTSTWDMASLSIFDLVSPKPELIVFGTGSEFSPLPADVRKHFYQMGVQVDIMSTKHAAATYNVLAEEGRRVAAALLPNSDHP
ncbi:NADH dehydrogenase 1 alpha subcomplex assembly factor 3 [Halteromyces radiatus]|uniref:NADH dehydrogenase 1 alpha subcomplex assembly factor 3 n=1 Tax=Halteromyces radiatus TaxID=101107 RepID=UPI00221FAAB5|nr:NADH dehydrogenase 1 alpha subcomplex assembly factor 3 [Halteromyces radiatus]KAI8098594.1 NADH dehydrogenase 1 alpha subcomplex assembly factor 3 [Halteromyces radiatus]